LAVLNRLIRDFGAGYFHYLFGRVGLSVPVAGGQHVRENTLVDRVLIWYK